MNKRYIKALLSWQIPFLAVLLVFGLMHASSIKAQETSSDTQTQEMTSVDDYSALTLATLCLDGDNDSRRGVEAEKECEQYIHGFVDAYLVVSQNPLCFPENVDRLDAIRRVYTPAVIQSSELRQVLANTALLDVLQDAFTCE